MEQGTHGVLGRSRTFLAVTALSLSVLTGAHAQQGGMDPALTYDAQTRGPVPIPSSERGLQTIVAEPWFKVSDEGLVLEGPAFDRAGNLLFCDVSGRRVLRLTPDKRLATVVSLDQLGPGGLAVHKDGRVFIAAMDLGGSVDYPDDVMDRFDFVVASVHSRFRMVHASRPRRSCAPLPIPAALFSGT